MSAMPRLWWAELPLYLLAGAVVIGVVELIAWLLGR